MNMMSTQFGVPSELINRVLPMPKILEFSNADEAVAGNLTLFALAPLAPESEAAEVEVSEQSLTSAAREINEAGIHPATRNQRTIVVGEDAAGNRYAASSNGFDKGQRAAADALGIKRVPTIKGKHAEESLMEAVPDVKRIGTWKRDPCGAGEHNCAGQAAAKGVEVERK
jgi:hypothetical protein